jgi:hypothetical protein
MRPVSRVRVLVCLPYAALRVPLPRLRCDVRAVASDGRRWGSGGLPTGTRRHRETPLDRGPYRTGRRERTGTVGRRGLLRRSLRLRLTVPTMTAFDVKRELKQCYAPKNTDWALIDVPEQQFVAIDGRGDPNTSAEYAHAVEALHAVAYTIKFASKRAVGRDFVVAPLEGLWWADDPQAFTARAKDSWQWTMLISQPDWVSEDMIEDAERVALAKKGLPTIADVRRETLREGTSAQVLHVGPYDDEGPVLAKLHNEYLRANKLRMSGRHHEIYLSDRRKTGPAKLRTILRQPVQPAE